LPNLDHDPSQPPFDEIGVSGDLLEVSPNANEGRRNCHSLLPVALLHNSAVTLFHETNRLPHIVTAVDSYTSLQRHCFLVREADRLWCVSRLILPMRSSERRGGELRGVVGSSRRKENLLLANAIQDPLRSHDPLLVAIAWQTPQLTDPILRTTTLSPWSSVIPPPSGHQLTSIMECRRVLVGETTT
jgi:hypothetical protein